MTTAPALLARRRPPLGMTNEATSAWRSEATRSATAVRSACPASSDAFRSNFATAERNTSSATSEPGNSTAGFSTCVRSALPSISSARSPSDPRTFASAVSAFCNSSTSIPYAERMPFGSSTGSSTSALGSLMGSPVGASPSAASARARICWGQPAEATSSQLAASRPTDSGSSSARLTTSRRNGSSIGRF